MAFNEHYNTALGLSILHASPVCFRCLITLNYINDGKLLTHQSHTRHQSDCSRQQTLISLVAQKFLNIQINVHGTKQQPSVKKCFVLLGNSPGPAVELFASWIPKKTIKNDQNQSVVTYYCESVSLNTDKCRLQDCCDCLRYLSV